MHGVRELTSKISCWLTGAVQFPHKKLKKAVDKRYQNEYNNKNYGALKTGLRQYPGVAQFW